MNTGRETWWMWTNNGVMVLSCHLNGSRLEIRDHGHDGWIGFLSIQNEMGRFLSKSTVFMIQNLTNWPLNVGYNIFRMLFLTSQTHFVYGYIRIFAFSVNLTLRKRLFCRISLLIIRWKTVYCSLKISSLIILHIERCRRKSRGNFQLKHGIFGLEGKHHLFPFSMQDSPGRNDKGFPHSSIGHVHSIQGGTITHPISPRTGYGNMFHSW